MEAPQSADVRVPPSGKVRRSEAARFLGLTTHTLVAWDRQGRGPRPIRVNGRCYYDFRELEQFAAGDA